MMKRAIISGVVLSSILLFGCNGEKEEGQVQAKTIDVIGSGQKEVVVPKNDESDFLSELQNEIIVSITEKTELDSESIAISLGGTVKEVISIAVGFPRDVKIDDTMIQQIVEDSIKNFFETEKVAVSKETILIKIERY